MPLPLCLALLLAAQDLPEPPPVTTGSDPWSALRLQLSGHLDLHYLYRSAAIEETGAQLNLLAPGTAGSSTQWSGRISLRADVEVKDLVSGVIELENRSFENGINKPFASSPPDAGTEIKQGYIEVGQFLTPDLNVRIGVQNVTLRNRPQDEPFFMDLGESEPFFRGYQQAGGFVSNSVDRDIGQPVGVRAFYSPVEVATLQAFWIVYEQHSATSQGESVYGLVANSLLAENWSSWILGTGVAGRGDGLGDIWTVGAGIDGYFGDSKDLELFAEVYGQGGTLQHSPQTVRKEAYAFNAGARYLGFFGHKLWVEAAVSRRSGDRHPGDDHDQAFQSYENVNRFVILESSEFGLDVDTNISQGRVAVGSGPFDVAGRPLRIQLDVGHFVAVTPIETVLPITGNDRQWGTETDLLFTWSYNQSLAFSLKGGWLADSELLRDLGGENHAYIVVFGADLRF